MSIKLIENGNIIHENGEILKVKARGGFVLYVKGETVSVNIEFTDDDGVTFINSKFPIVSEGVYQIVDANGLYVSVTSDSVADYVRIT